MQPTNAVIDVIVNIMIQLLSILAVATTEIKQGRSSESIDTIKFLCLPLLEKLVKKLLGKKDVEDALKKLDTLTMEEVRMAMMETLKVSNRVEGEVGRVDNQVHGVDNQAIEVDNNVVVFIDSGQCVSLIIYVFLKVDMARCERSYTAFDEHCR